MSLTSPSQLSFGTFSVTSTLGAIFIGEVLAAIVYGIGMLQMYTYFAKNWRSGPVSIKVLLAAIFLLSTAHFLGYTYATWFYTIASYLNPLVLIDTVHWSFQVSFFTGVGCEMIIGMIYSYKIYELGGMHFWNIAMLIMWGIAGGFGFAFAACLNKYNMQELRRINWLLYTSLSARIVRHTMSTFVVSSSLWRMRTGVRRTESMIKSLMSFAINYMALSNMVAIACIVAMAASPNTLVFVPFLVTQPSTLINSLLAFLNTRDVINDAPEPMSIHLSKIRIPAERGSDNDAPPLMLQARHVREFTDFEK